MREFTTTFGNENCIVGVITEPDSDLYNRGTPAILLWNAGLLHRVGPFRLYVDLARKLSSMGFFVLRFDSCGKGDSMIPSEIHSVKEMFHGDIWEAMNHIKTKRKIDEFVLIGLCSGADEAFSMAALDPRISGIVLLDGLGYRTLGYYVHRYFPKILNINKYYSYIKLRFSYLLEKCQGNCSSKNTKVQMSIRPFPSRKKATRDMQKLVQKGVKILAIYTGGLQYHYYNYKNQFFEMFKTVNFKDKLQLEYLPSADHTYTILEERANMIGIICSFLKKTYLTSVKE
jgi:hypothetical protein